MSSAEGRSGALRSRAVDYLDRLCLPYPDRHVGGPGNAVANELFAATAAGLGFRVERTPFECVVWEPGDARVETGAGTWDVNAGPYSLAVDVTAPLSVVESVEELEAADVEGHVLLLCGSLVAEQLTPKNYPFYSWDSHTRIVTAIEAARPAAIVAATGRSSELVGSLYPFPLIEDADFDIPHAFMTDVDGSALREAAGTEVRLRISSGRRAAVAEQVVAASGPAERRIVVSGHIDSRRGSPGAIDNATGVVVLLLVAELLGEQGGEVGVELVPFNGEDDYAAPGEMTYLAARGDRLRDEVVLNINVDGVGWVGHDAEVSTYECSAEVVEIVRDELQWRERVVEGDPWPQSDHMVFVMRGIPAVALTTADAAGLRMHVAHTDADVPAVVDPDVVVAAAEYVADVVRRLTASAART